MYCKFAFPNFSTILFYSHRSFIFIIVLSFLSSFFHFYHRSFIFIIVLSFLSSFFHFYHRSFIFYYRLANLVAIATKFAVRGIAIRKSLLFHHQFILGHSLHIRLDDGFHLTFHRLTYRRFPGLPHCALRASRCGNDREPSFSDHPIATSSHPSHTDRNRCYSLQPMYP